MSERYILSAVKALVSIIFALCTLCPYAAALPQNQALAVPANLKVTVARVLVFDEAGNVKLETYRIPQATGRYATVQTQTVDITKKAAQSKAIATSPKPRREDQRKSVSGPKNKASKKSHMFAVQPARGEYFVQVGAFRNSRNARNLQKQVSYSHTASIKQATAGQKKIYKVLVGPLPSIRKAKRVQKHITRQDGLSAAFVVRIPIDS